ncbi:MAG: polysaccharide deacetylase family protein [Deltaproteobacteria bacterium]|nr:polysaccharide deacetylase family protein [Deltaproteobacteria bacterium]
MKSHPVPIIMYHSVRPARNPKWVYSHLTLELPYFIRQLEYFKKNDYYVASLDEIIAHKKGIKSLPARSVCLTFDDGYLDNWVFAFPLLRKHGFRATIFVSPEFILGETDVRPNLEDCWSGHSDTAALVSDGFLSWAELQEMQKSGIIDVESHTMTHTFYPITDQIVDFHYPDDFWIWLKWNADKMVKPFYMTQDQEGLVSFGTPVYESSQAIVARRVDEDGTLTNYIVNYVRLHGGAAFFSRFDWRQELFSVSQQYTKQHSVVYKRETETDYFLRLKYELAESKQIIENHLSKPVSYLCWPNGGWNEDTHAMALHVGYVATTAKGSSNVFDSPDPTRLLRMGLHQVGESKTISRLFVTYALNAHREVWPYAQLRRLLRQVGATPILKKLLY